MNPILQAELTEHLTKWLKDKGALEIGGILTISVNITQAAPVVLKINDEKIVLKSAIKKMGAYGTRIECAVENHNLTLGAIQRMKLTDIKKYPGVGHKTLAGFSYELRQEGVECLWMNELDSHLDNHPVTYLKLSVRALNVLSRAKIITIGELRKKTPEDIRLKTLVGRKTFIELYDTLLSKGVRLPWNICTITP